jgi:probable DNA repair protein
LLLELASGLELEPSEITELLLSPFFDRARRELTRRARADLILRGNLRRRLHTSATLAGLIEVASSKSAENGERACPVLATNLAQVAALRSKWDTTALPSAWASRFALVLDAAGWLAEQTSHEYQLHEVWTEILGTLASLDRVCGQIAGSAAVKRLIQLADNRLFQFEDRGAPVQVVDLAEAQATRFDALWIVGLDQNSWPPAGRAHPLLPFEVQQRAGLPHTSAQSDFERAERALQLLLDHSQHTVLSYARNDANGPLRPSAALHYSSAKVEPPLALPTWAELQPTSKISLEAVIDNRAPSLPAGSVHGGGARVAELQAACPFQAFAELRLRANEVEPVPLGLDPSARGSLMHKVLQTFWNGVRTSDTLRAFTPALRRELLRAAAEQAVVAKFQPSTPWQHRFVSLEIRRLVQLVSEWLDFELTRALPFEVCVDELERKRTVEIGGLTLDLRLDRVDRVAGRHVILDYKSTAPKTDTLAGERPYRPQLLLYGATAGYELAGLAFAQVASGKMRFTGYANPNVLPGVNPPETCDGNRGFAAATPEWRDIVERLVNDFREGLADVDPHPEYNVCRLCAMKSLCRIAAKGKAPQADGAPVVADND